MGPVMVNFTCPVCETLCSHPTAGVKVYCPKCGQKLLVPTPRNKTVLGTSSPVTSSPTSAGPTPAPASPSLEVIPVLMPVDEEEEDNPHLTACPACGRSIAKEAATCPSCGAPNKWVHPEIVRFFNVIRTFDFPPSVRFQCEKYVLVGVDEKAHRNAQGIADLANSFFVIAPLNVGGLLTLAGAHTGKIALNEWARKKVKAFRIDFAHNPPAWWSTDNAYWWDVMVFFRLRKRTRKPHS